MTHEDPPACPQCGLMVGVCDDYPDCPGGNVVRKPDAFAEAWKAFEDAGYRYGSDALEQVRFGFNIARGLKPEKATPEQMPRPARSRK